MGYSSEDKAGRKGIETVCRVCQTNGAGPCGKEIIIGSVSVKHVNTIQKRGVMGRRRGGPRQCCSLWGPRGPGLSAATLALPKNVCNPQADWGDPVALPGNAAGFSIVRNAHRGKGGNQKKRRGGLVGHWGGGVLFSARPYESSPLLSENYNCTFLIFCALLLTVVID